MARRKIKSLGILTGGGDCPGLNAVIRAVSKTAMNDHGLRVVGILDSYSGLVNEVFRELSNNDVSGILATGGTILGTSRLNPFVEAHQRGLIPKPNDDWRYVKKILKRHQIDVLIAIGGDGTLRVAERAYAAGIPIIGIPKTIDNDLSGTDITFGFDSAVSVVMQALDMLHSTAMSHHRAMVVEVMGRTAGWLALHAGIAGGGDIICIPEIPYSEAIVCKRVEQRSRVGKRFSIIVVAEGAQPTGGAQHFSGKADKSGRRILGGIGQQLAECIESETGIATRLTTLGHLQRCGPPTAFDRLLATQLGHEAVRLAMNGEFGRMVAWRRGRVTSVDLKRATARTKRVPPGHRLIAAARSVGTCFGD